MAITIENITTQLIDIPIKRPHQFSTTKISSKSFVLVQFTLSNGEVGVGEGTTPGIWWNGESVETMQLVIHHYMKPLLLGQDPRNIEKLMSVLDRQIRQNHFAKATVEMALYDAVGKLYDAPVYQLLGGLYSDSIPVRWALASGTPNGDIEEADELYHSGSYDTFKIKSGKETPENDAKRSVHIASGVKGYTTIGVDPNGSWNRLVTKKWMGRFADASIDFLEQPLPPGDMEGLAQLVDMKQVPIMADESVCSLHDAMKLVKEKAADIFSLKIHKLGGMRNTMKVAAIAEASDISCFGGTSLESSIGTAACLHAYGAIRNLDYGSELFGPDWLADDLVKEPLMTKQGKMKVPDKPGLGITLDEEKVAKYVRKSKEDQLI